MSEHEVKYQGEVDIYLQGQDALEPTIAPPALMAYYVGCPSSKILVKDHRNRVAEAARLALSGIDEEKFANVFNEHAWVDIRSTDDQAEIEIFDGRGKGDVPVLWLGVISDGKMGAYDVDWEIIKPLGGTQFAFAAIVR
jgi:hypothetical protein